MRSAVGFSLLAVALGLEPLAAELPLPDVTLYGKITDREGNPVIAGELSAEVKRGATPVLNAAGGFVPGEGEVWYVVRIPLETSIGAPGPSGVAAREGDLLAALLLAGVRLELALPVAPLKAGSVLRLDATGSIDTGGLRYIRGDCKPDRERTLTDAVFLLNFLFLGAERPPCLEACDGDGDGELTLTDAIFVLGFLFLGGIAPPPPGPDCDVDPTPSLLGCITSNCAA